MELLQCYKRIRLENDNLIAAYSEPTRLHKRKEITMGYVGGTIVPGNCEDIPACGHYDLETGETFCPQPPPTAQERAEAEENAEREREEDLLRIANLPESCEVYLAHNDDVPETWNVEKIYVSFIPKDEEKQARNTWRENSTKFHEEADKHNLGTWSSLKTLAASYGLTLDGQCGQCRECHDENEAWLA